MRPLPAPERDEVREEEKELWDAVMARQRAMTAYSTPDGREVLQQSHGTPYYEALLNSPQFCYHQNTLGKLVRQAGDHPDTYSHADREWVDQVLCHDFGTNCVMTGHLEDALAHGVRIEAILALREGRENDLTEDERQLTDYIRSVVDGTVTDEQFEAMTERMNGKRGVVEFTFFITFLTSTMRLIQALTGDDGPSDEEVMERIRGFHDGTIPTPTQPSIAPG